ncbi:MAG: hypothetical protein AVDCRST_MAG57-3515, partial [uncultured Blastococcus sp.]
DAGSPRGRACCAHAPDDDHRAGRAAPGARRLGRGGTCVRVQLRRRHDRAVLHPRRRRLHRHAPPARSACAQRSDGQQHRSRAARVRRRPRAEGDGAGRAGRAVAGLRRQLWSGALRQRPVRRVRRPVHRCGRHLLRHADRRPVRGLPVRGHRHVDAGPGGRTPGARCRDHPHRDGRPAPPRSERSGTGPRAARADGGRRRLRRRPAGGPAAASAPEARRGTGSAVAPGKPRRQRQL